MFWEQVKRVRKIKKLKYVCTVDVDGKVLSEKNEVCKVQELYFESLGDMTGVKLAMVTPEAESRAQCSDQSKKAAQKQE